MSEREFDVVVVGAGPAGEVAAGRLADAGLEVALVERELVGGECSFYACMPSKALLRPGQLLAEVRRVPGVEAGELDVQAVLDRRDEVIHDLDDSGMLPWLEERDITLVRGHARIEGERAVRVGDELLRARKAIVLGVGTEASLPPVDGLEAAKPWTNREVTTAKAIPESLIVLGAGPVGCEMAQAYSGLGATVTLIEPAPRVLPREEELASELVAEGLREWGVTVHEGVKPTAVRREGDGTVVVETDGAGELRAAELLVAAGRKPLTSDLGVEVLGLEPGKPIEVDDSLRHREHHWLYVIGDANGRTLLTHMGKHQARLAGDHILGKGSALRPSAAHPPRVTFTEPQVAATGMTSEQAREAGLNVRTVDASTSGNAGGSFVGKDAPGRTMLVVDTDRNVLVGATFTGADVQDFVHAATIAIVAEVPLDVLWHAIPAFPTRSEVWLRLMEELGL